jgi:hypothetical protein
MSVKCHRQAAHYEIRVTFDNDANSVALDRAHASIADAGNGDAFYDERRAGGDDLAAMVG